MMPNTETKAFPPRQSSQNGENTSGAMGYEQAALSEIYLPPGRIVASCEPAAIRSILGSCVAVCLWDPRLKVGGMAHYMLPNGGTEENSSARFGNIAIERLIEKLLDMGAQKKNLKAKIFGGACVIEAFNKENHLGKKNVRMARKVLANEAIPVLNEDVEGRLGRRIIFRVADGTALIKVLK